MVMLEIFIAAVQGLAPSALLLTLAAVASRACGRGARWPRGLGIGLAAGVLGGVSLAVLRETTRVVNRELISLWTLGLFLPLLLTLIVLTWQPARTARPIQAAQPGQAARPEQAAQSGQVAQPGRDAQLSQAANPSQAAQSGQAGRRGNVAWVSAVAAVAALALFRAVAALALQLAGFQTSGEPLFSTDAALRLLGFAGGLGATAAAAVVLYRASDGAKPLTARLGLSVALFGTVYSAGVGMAQLLIARRLIAAPRWLFKTTVWGINHPNWPLALLALAAIAVPLATLSAARKTATLTANPAQARWQRARKRRRLRYSLASAGAYIVLGGALTVGAALAARVVELSPPEPFEMTAVSAVIRLEDVDDGHLHRFAYTTASGVEVRFIVIKKNGVAYGVGLDACEICGPTGYYEKDGKIICRLCDVVMNIATIGYKGGCNPIPLDYQIDGGIVVQLADLEAAASVFA
ncbi:MAG: DUF2318 domain-containing protein [Propionibacteriaceae bacterium]|jgi:uncharacterized membrane protein|nr:DUF2318 domain-containing protein [Propionibacteriaceae bacterium]